MIEVVGGKGVARRLGEMGIYPGKTLKVLKNHGAVLVRVNGTEYLLGRGIARKVVVNHEIRRLSTRNL